jgi:hypothetical protein
MRSADPLAILPAYNEADVIGAVLDDLIAQGCQVHVLDNLSTDGTAEIARSLLGRGVVDVELFVSDRYTWAAMLRRVEEIALSHVGRWIILANADEFRESPWPWLTLADAIGHVDRYEYNAIDHDLFNFRPVDDSFVPGTDPRLHMRHYEPVDPSSPDAIQLKTWQARVRPGRSGLDGRPLGLLPRPAGLPGQVHAAPLPDPRRGPRPPQGLHRAVPPVRPRRAGAGLARPV